MNSTTLSMLLTKLGTMDGRYWPAMREGEEMDADRLSYAEVLIDLTDEVGARMLRSVLTAFDKRPSHKALREWGVSLAPVPSFDIRQLDGPVSPGAHRLTGPGLERIGGGMPAWAKEKIEKIRAGMVPVNDRQEWGLQFTDKGTGKVSRTQPSYSKDGAEQKAAERNEKWAHQVTTIYHRGEPLPATAKRYETPELRPALVSKRRFRETEVAPRAVVPTADEVRRSADSDRRPPPAR